MLSAVTDFLTTHKDALIAVTWIIAGANWIITNRQANRREVRKETRGEIDALIKALTELLGKCRVYYQHPATDAQDKTRSAEIAFEIKRILTRTQTMADRQPGFQLSADKASDLWERITGDPFQSSARQVVAADGPELQEIESAALALIDALEQGFSEGYAHGPGRRLRVAARHEADQWLGR
ncbi:MAG: hypothetical protein JSS56_07820 [Proteobacteria bacterium]|nr:hypothetical protein [Pseudomonadota bacterium]